MGWERESSTWLDMPNNKTMKLEPFKDRGTKFLADWVDSTLEAVKTEKNMPLQIGIGFEYDAETNVHRGAMLSCKFGDNEPTYFRPGELAQMVEFLRSQFADVNEEGRDLFDLDSFVEVLEYGIAEAEKFSTEMKKQ